MQTGQYLLLCLYLFLPKYVVIRRPCRAASDWPCFVAGSLLQQQTSWNDHLQSLFLCSCRDFFERHFLSLADDSFSKSEWDYEFDSRPFWNSDSRFLGRQRHRYPLDGFHLGLARMWLSNADLPLCLRQHQQKPLRSSLYRWGQCIPSLFHHHFAWT